MNRNTIILR